MKSFSRMRGLCEVEMSFSFAYAAGVIAEHQCNANGPLSRQPLFTYSQNEATMRGSAQCQCSETQNSDWRMRQSVSEAVPLGWYPTSNLAFSLRITSYTILPT